MKDAGLQPERTALAWRRTVLALAANGVLVCRSAWGQQRPAWVLAALALASLTLVGWLLALRRTATLAHAPARPMAAGHALALALGTATCAGIGLWLALRH